LRWTDNAAGDLVGSGKAVNLSVIGFLFVLLSSWIALVFIELKRRLSLGVEGVHAPSIDHHFGRLCCSRGDKDATSPAFAGFSIIIK
jgi:hypothetical protein